MIKIGSKLKCVNSKPLQGNDVAPPLKEGETYEVKDIVIDSEGNPHLDVGLKSNYNYITSWNTKEELPDGDTIHLCALNRFEEIN
jgi:hypothetical protein